VTDSKSFVFRFGDFEVKEHEFLLIKAGGAVPVEPKAFRVLLFLLRNPGRLLKKDEILNAVWNDCSVTDNSLTRSIATLRRLLGDDSREPHYIATVQTVGYRFLGEVVATEDVTAGDRFLCAALVESGGAYAVTAPPVHNRFRSLAVLPFTNGTGPEEAEYLSEGISESIINLISQFPDIRVVPRSSAFRYRGTNIELKEVARDLNVDVVLTGTVTQRGDRLVVQTELVDAKNDAQIWGSQFNRKFDDIFELQEELSRHICECLRPRLTPHENELLRKRPTENREAYLLYLKAMYFANKWSPDGIQKGIAYSKQAVEADPLFAQAYAGLAYLYFLVSVFGGLPPRQVFPMAKAATLKALEIDDALATAHACMAQILLSYDWDWAGAGKESYRAIELAPNIPGGHYVLSQWLLSSGRSGEAVAEA
jgi:TolB-like protein/DNA-binding winged helix-turn-helix (wHTH) protein